jgi:hypothetical protein
MEVSRKSWHYKLFRLVGNESSGVSWSGYLLWSFLGLLMFPFAVYGSVKLAFFLGDLLNKNFPHLAVPVMQVLGALLFLIILHIAIRNTRAYLGLISWLDKPKAKIFPPVNFVD